jgi:HK97 family phage portal protein
MGGLNWLAQLLRRGSYGIGKDDPMTPDRALSYAPVWYAVNKIAGHVAYLPLNLHLQKGRENTRPKNHMAYRLLRIKSNAYQTPYVFKRQMMTHALLWGNGRAFINRQGLRSELIPLAPDRCITVMIEGEKIHLYKVDRDERLSLFDDIQNALKTYKEIGGYPGLIPLMDSEVIHVHGLGFDGLQGKSLISLASQSWNLGLGAETQERKKQKKGYSGGLMLEAPEHMLRTEGEAKEFLKWFRDEHDGENNAGKTGLLRGGIKANVMAMSNSDAQFIEQRKFQRQDAALWFMLEQILGDDSSVSYNSLEQKNLAYLQNCLAPWLTIWEEETESKLLSTNEIEKGYYIKFNDGALLRTDKLTTMQFASAGITSRILNPNEGREMFDMNPYEGGDTFENPAVTPGTPGSSLPAPNPNGAAAAMIRNLIGVEANRVRNGIKAKNFLDWMERFYAKWETKLAESITAIGGDSQMAKNHCEESKRQLLACSDATSEKFSEVIEACVSSWPERVDVILEEMELLQC